MMRLSSLLLSMLLLLACGEDAPTEAEPTETSEPTETAETPETPHVALDVDDPAVCATCHAAVVAEWQTSMHAHAHHDSDVVYAAMRTFRIGREGEELGGRCAQCHSPRDPEHQESAIARTGVSCGTCHNLEGVDTAEGQRGARALTRATGDTLRGPHDVEAEGAPHGTGAAAPWLTDGQTICLTCHGDLQNSASVATCTTGSEYSGSEDAQPCTTCHMPMVDRPNGAVSQRPNHRSHAFLGAHTLYGPEGSNDSEFMASGFQLTPTLEGTNLSVAVVNRTDHALPTGFPGRMILVRAIGYDSEGESVWQNFTDAPMQQDPDAVFNKVYVDAEGSPTMPPYGVRIARDTRLTPAETRQLSWTVPRNVVRAQISLIYRLLPPPAAQTLGIADATEAGPRVFLTVAVP